MYGLWINFSCVFHQYRKISPCTRKTDVVVEEKYFCWMYEAVFIAVQIWEIRIRMKAYLRRPRGFREEPDRRETKNHGGSDIIWNGTWFTQLSSMHSISRGSYIFREPIIVYGWKYWRTWNISADPFPYGCINELWDERDWKDRGRSISERGNETARARVILPERPVWKQLEFAVSKKSCKPISPKKNNNNNNNG